MSTSIFGSSTAIIPATTAAEMPVAIDPTGGYWNPASPNNQKYPSDADLVKVTLASWPGQSWLDDPANAKYIRNALDYLGAAIPAPGGCQSGCKWASTEPYHRLLMAIKYFRQFDFKFNYGQADCINLANIITAIDNESINVQQQRVAGSLGVGETGVQIAILGDMKSKITTAMSNLNCTQYLNDLAQSSFLGTVQDQIAQSSATEDASGQTTKYIIWGMLGVVVLVSLVIVFKKKS